MAFGAIERCPKCSGGRPKFMGGYYICPGYMDDDEFKFCKFASTQVKRTKWDDEE
jgi:hypothetical protein